MVIEIWKFKNIAFSMVLWDGPPACELLLTIGLPKIVPSLAHKFSTQFGPEAQS
jgi:hypothetical protein